MQASSTPSLFGDLVSEVPKTQGIKYAGSKLKLLPHILDLAAQAGAQTIFDGFSGSTRVSQAFAKSGFQVFSNDIAVWSEVFGKCYLLNTCPRESYAGMIKELNAAPPKDGWYTEHYGGCENGGCATQADGLKKPWQIHNTRKLDGVRDRIDELGLSPVEKAVALTSLILALDRVDNTLGHYVSYLREWAPRSYDELRLEIPEVFVSRQDHRVTRHDIFSVADCDADLAYYDPPYGSGNEKMPPSRVRYASYYHPWTTICLNDKPEIFGKAMRRADTSDKLAGSVFEEFKRNPDTGRFIAVEAIERLVRETRSRWILLSYSSSGRGTAEELDAILKNHGEIVAIRKIDYQRNVMAHMHWTHEWLNDMGKRNQEFLFLIDKG